MIFFQDQNVIADPRWYNADSDPAFSKKFGSASGFCGWEITDSCKKMCRLVFDSYYFLKSNCKFLRILLMSKIMGKCQKEQFWSCKIEFLLWNLTTWIRKRISILTADPDAANHADQCEFSSGSATLIFAHRFVSVFLIQIRTVFNSFMRMQLRF